MSQTTIRSGREPASYPEYEEILRLFRAGRYGEALPRFSAFLSAHLPELSGRGEAMVRRNIVACRKGLLSPDLAGRTPDGSFPPGWSELVQEVQSYLAALPCADQLAPDPIRAFLGDWLPLVVAYEADPGPLLAELPGRLPERFLPLFFEALQAQFFAETTNYARQGHVRTARALGELYLELTGPGREAPAQASSAAARAAILIRLADLAFFAAPGEPGQAGIEAAALLDRALAEQPGNPFARRLRRHIEEREATIQQIRRFQHDTSSRIGALREALGQLDGAVGELPAGLRSPLGAVRSNLRFITAVNDLVQGRAPSERQYRRIDPAEVCREALAQLGLPLACLELTGLPAAWELVPE
ncbi:MAG: hypothetical protein FJ125_11355, partial [Deltaproteobacteria bacterium]|nr:hypothetical protein [Deltaproteobacteria bacterium]